MYKTCEKKIIILRGCLNHIYLSFEDQDFEGNIYFSVFIKKQLPLLSDTSLVTQPMLQLYTKIQKKNFKKNF